jgi:hypothetical protein
LELAFLYRDIAEMERQNAATARLGSTQRAEPAFLSSGRWN